MHTHLLLHVPALLASTPPKPDREPRSRRTREEQAQLDADMWTAIEAADLQGLSRALSEGASTKKYRNGYPPLWVSVQLGRYDLTEALLGAGADPTAKGRSGRSVWAALAARDNPQEADRLKALIGDARLADPSDFLNVRAYALLWWWLHEGGEPLLRVLPTNSPSYNADAWVLAALRGHEGLLPLLNQAWGIDPTNPHGLVETWDDRLGRVLWQEIARRDDLGMAKRALTHGWGPPDPSNLTSVGRHEFENDRQNCFWLFDLGWLFVAKRAWHLWAWWTSVPALAENFWTDGETDPDNTLWPFVYNVPAVERLSGLGFDFGIRNKNGDLLAHYLFAGPHASLALVDWWIAHRPADLQVENAKGHTPLNQPLREGARAATLAKIRARHMALTLDKATAPNLTRKRL